MILRVDISTFDRCTTIFCDTNHSLFTAFVIGEEGDLFEGDIKIDWKRRRSIDLPPAKQPALNPSGTLWPNGTVYFKFHENISKL